MSTVNLIVVAHPDDEILGFGGTGAKLVMAGEVVQPLILSGNVEQRSRRPESLELQENIANANKLVGFRSPILGSFPNIQMNTVPHIELVQFIEHYIEKEGPRRIFTHHPTDLNDDHRQVSQSCMAACRLFQRREDIAPVESLHFMEIQSATDWALDEARLTFRPNLFVEITSEFENKIEALHCYKNIMRDYPHPRSEEALRAIATIRGAQAGLKLAEAFQTIFQRGLP